MASTHQLKVQDIFSVKDYVCLVCTLFEKSLSLSAPFMSKSQWGSALLAKHFYALPLDGIDLENENALLANVFGIYYWFLS